MVTGVGEKGRGEGGFFREEGLEGRPEQTSIRLTYSGWNLAMGVAKLIACL